MTFLSRRLRAAGADGQVPFEDTFTRPDSATTLGTADTGQVWANAAGTHGIITNGAYAPTATVGDNIALVESSTSNGRVVVDVTMAAGSRTNAGLIFRGIDVNNFLVVVLGITPRTPSGTANFVDLYKRDAGTYTQLAALGTAGNVAATTHTFEVVMAGSSITIRRDGVQKVAHTLSAANQTKYGGQTKIGLRTFRSDTNDDGSRRYDNLRVYSS